MVFAIAVLAGLAGWGAAWPQGQITIQAGWVDPPLFQATVNERITFINSSGRAAHVEFFGDSQRHHVTQVLTEIWVIFHTSGRHPYVVHFPESGAADLRGEVEVIGDPRERPDGRACDGITVMGACLER